MTLDDADAAMPRASSDADASAGGADADQIRTCCAAGSMGRKRRKREERKATKKLQNASSGGKKSGPTPPTPKMTPVPTDMLTTVDEERKRQNEHNKHALTSIEREHVMAVYDTVAEQWHATRYKPWPKVVDFVQTLPPRSLIADVGSGNGKHAAAATKLGHEVVCVDFSASLCAVSAASHRLDNVVGDAAAPPLRRGAFDAALSIAVLHHVATLERRQALVAETMRCLRVGGRALFYAWAREQERSGGTSGHEFGKHADVLVPWHHRTFEHGSKATADEAQRLEVCRAAAPAQHGVVDAEKRAVIYQRYCHVYEAGELDQLFEPIKDWVDVVRVYEDTGNHCVEARRTA
eukprot:CAMPEP_0119193164 /NCGR_PEP_ID=MMETSP1316-20130426/3425_1 /TAXON_ID=41880 /ORGANISM="Pycnococcus provasolii, Strain RCC2336" /LENGTH=349 /DNA_ID=CAMNT_0007188417 /DNA_START=226 /DNA_END=1275 /DNA_ORIENTATION=-